MNIGCQYCPVRLRQWPRVNMPTCYQRFREDWFHRLGADPQGTSTGPKGPLLRNGLGRKRALAYSHFILRRWQGLKTGEAADPAPAWCRNGTSPELVRSAVNLPCQLELWSCCNLVCSKESMWTGNFFTISAHLTALHMKFKLHRWSWTALSSLLLSAK